MGTLKLEQPESRNLTLNPRLRATRAGADCLPSTCGGGRFFLVPKSVASNGVRAAAAFVVDDDDDHAAAAGGACAAAWAAHGK